MNVQLTADQNDLIKKIALEEGFSDFELETESGSIKGDGYFGNITSVNIKNKSKKLNLILKSAHMQKDVREKIPIRKAYLREIYIYERMFQEFGKFQVENGVVDGFSGYAKFYGSCDKEYNECLVLENLKEVGYKLWSRTVPMNSDHVALVFAEYGKLHATSLAMDCKKPQAFKNLTQNLENIFKDDSADSSSRMRQFILGNGFKAVEGNDLATAAMKRFETGLKDFFNHDLEMPDDQLVLLHGDCWCNNMMFKYEDNRDVLRPTKVCLIDWQVSKIGSPALDLAYFFFVCSPKEILVDFERYLKLYHDSVSESLKKFSCDVETIFPYTLLEYHWKKYAKFALFMALMIIKVMLTEGDEVPDLAELVGTKKDFFENMSGAISLEKVFNQRIVDIVTVMAENNLI